MDQAHAKNTRGVYSVGVNKFFQFNAYISVDYCRIISPANRFLLFVVYLSHICNLKHSTIKVYAAAVRNWHIRNGLTDPALVKGIKNPSLSLLMRGIKRNQALQGNRERHPLTIEKLGLVLKAANWLGLSFAASLELKAALLIGFWGFMRSAEFCSHDDGTSCLKNKNVTVHVLADGTEYLMLLLTSTKTNQFKPTPVYIYANNSSLCAVRAVKLYNKLVIRQFCDPEGPFLSTGVLVLTAKKFNALFKLVVGKAGLDKTKFSAHSLRSGAATTAANSGVAPYLIKQLGRWKSDCYNIYIKEPVTATKGAQSSMVDGGRV